MNTDSFGGQIAGFGPTFAAQKLDELYGTKVSRETLRKAMQQVLFLL